MVGWMELGDRVQVALMKCHMASDEDGVLPRSEEHKFLPCHIELDKAKCILLSGNLSGDLRGSCSALVA